MPAVLDALLKAGDEVEQSEVEQTAAALAQKMSNPDGRAGAIRTLMGTETSPEAQARLIGLLPLIGDRSTLPLLRTALASGVPSVVDAAVGAITSWPTSAARDDIMRLAHTSKNETHRLLAIRGFVRVVGLDQYREPAAAVAESEAGSRVGAAPGGETACAGGARAVRRSGGSGAGEQVPARQVGAGRGAGDDRRHPEAYGRGARGLPVGQGGDTGE